MTERNNIISNIFRSLLVVVALVVALPYAEAQRPTLSGSFSRDTVEVGDHFDYILDITKDRATEIGIPDFGDRLSQKEREELAKRKIKMSTFTDYDEDIFELVESFPIDTISVDNRTLHIRKRYRLAVMETGTMHLHPTILYFEKNRDKILKDAEDAATKQVRLWYVLEAIAKAENIEAKDEERGKKVIDFVLANVKK